MWLFFLGGFFFVCLFIFLSTVNSEPLEQSKNVCFPFEVSPILLEVFSDGDPDNELIYACYLNA